MDVQKLAVGFLAVLACSRSPEDAGIVLNIDTDVTADRTVIDYITVTVDSRRQEWILTHPLPGSLGIKTSPGNKSVTVEGFSNGVLRGRWSSTIVASKGKVVVRDVHLAYVGPSLDGGASLLDGGAGEVIDTAGVRDGAVDAGADSVDSGGKDVAGMDGAGDISDRDVGLGKDTLAGFVDGGAEGTTGTGGISGSDGGLDRGEVWGLDGALGSDGPLIGDDGASVITEPLTGAFSVNSQFQIPATSAATGRLGATLQLVHGLAQDPGAAILQFAADAGVPKLATLRSALPDVLMSRLSEWMDSYLKTATVNGVSPYDRLAWLDDTIQSLLLNWELQSRLVLPIDGPGTHTPVSFVFVSPAGPVPLEPTAPVTPGVGVTATVSWPNGSDGAAIVSISDHTMGLPFGRYALQALNAILLADYGVANTADYLSSAVDCSAMAESVASRCVSIVCVGHAVELTAVCEGGLAEGAKQIENQILGLDFKAIHFEHGIAIAAGSTVSRPQDATSLENGVWTATIDFGDGPQPATATFTASAEIGSP